MVYQNLNLSQREIAMSEAANIGENAINTISLKIHLYTVSPSEAKAALDRVLSEADVFSAALRTDEQIWRLEYLDAPCSLSSILDEKSEDEAVLYMTAADKQPIKAEKELYRSEIIPLSCGGCIVYIRFHHLIIDGYGMSLLAQKVFDVLGGKGCSLDPFAANASIDEDGSSPAFYQEYFSEAEIIADYCKAYQKV